MGTGTHQGHSRPLGIVANIATTDIDGLARLKGLEALEKRYALQGTARQLLPDYRVANCLRVPLAGHVEVWQHAEHRSASYGGLQTCGSVHVCPCCGQKVTERRREEIGRAITTHSDRGGSLLFVTFTLRHELGDALRDVAGALAGAYRRLKQGRSWALFSARHAVVGSIAATEYTHGAAGWHPHKHVLFLVGRQPALRELVTLERWLKRAWGAAVAGQGGYASATHGVRVDWGDAAVAAYMVKAGHTWTLADELARANRKRGRHGRTPQQLLADATAGDGVAGALYQEYAAATYRTNALVWSRGLRAALGLTEDEQTDEQVAASMTAAGQLLVVLARDVWRVVLAHDARADLLMVAKAGDVDAITDFLRSLGANVDNSVFDGYNQEGAVK